MILPIPIYPITTIEYVGAVIVSPGDFVKQNLIAAGDHIKFPSEIPIICVQIMGREVDDRPYIRYRNHAMN